MSIGFRGFTAMVLALALLSACGGGGDSGGSTNPPPSGGTPPPPPSGGNPPPTDSYVADAFQPASTFANKCAAPRSG
ncbi:MAG: hypothetical protein LBE59_01185, partial [Nevskiaceae bacterium]|nr:hypothetical protein [Nevskiaceae bacterium]